MNARLVKSAWLLRRIEVVAPDGRRYLVEYNGRGAGYESVRVNGSEVCRDRSQFWFVPRFCFRLGVTPAVVAVRVWPWLALRSVYLWVDGALLCAEGPACEPGDSADESAHGRHRRRRDSEAPALPRSGSRDAGAGGTAP